MSLCSLNIRHNLLVEIPVGQYDAFRGIFTCCIGTCRTDIKEHTVNQTFQEEMFPVSELCKLQLRHLDLSQNKISHVPVELRRMDSLVDLNLHYNPLICPPAHVCSSFIIQCLFLKAFLQRANISSLYTTKSKKKISLKRCQKWCQLQLTHEKGNQ